MACALGKPGLTNEELMAAAVERKRIASERSAAAALRPRLTAEERRERDRLRSAERYKTHRERERARVIAYKKRRPEKNTEWGHRRRVRERNGYVAPVDLDAVKRSRKACIYCLAPITPTTATADHLIAIAIGGEHSPRNLVACCMSCNSTKCDKPLDVWLKQLTPERRRIIERICELRGLTQSSLPLTVGRENQSARRDFQIDRDRPWRCGCWSSRGIRCPGHTPKKRLAS